MKLYDSDRAPNPRRVRVFLAEKGIAVPLVSVDIGALEHKSQTVSSRNPLRHSLNREEIETRPCR